MAGEQISFKGQMVSMGPFVRRVFHIFVADGDKRHENLTCW
jgi:hypothetical protein